ncbi:hypothetical protein ACFV4N_23735 [Actinosynnema sp. NPDC059797]
MPVVVQVTGWNPDEGYAFGWHARSPARDHRPGRPVRWVAAAALLEGDLTLPVADGLATIADDLWPQAITAVNRLGSPVPLVTCGLAEYRELEAAGIGLTRVIRADLLTLGRDDLEECLTEAVPRGADRLAPLFARLRAEPVPTPPAVWLIRVVGQASDRDPGELRDRGPTSSRRSTPTTHRAGPVGPAGRRSPRSTTAPLSAGSRS